MYVYTRVKHWIWLRVCIYFPRCQPLQITSQGRSRLATCMLFSRASMMRQGVTFPNPDTRKTKGIGPRKTSTYSLALLFSFIFFIVLCGMVWISMLSIAWTLEHTIKEGYVVQALLSYARRYWRKSLIKTTLTPEAVQLQAVCRPNDRRARETCRKATRSGEGTTDSFILIYLAYGWSEGIKGMNIYFFYRTRTAPVPESMSAASAESAREETWHFMTGRHF